MARPILSFPFLMSSALSVLIVVSLSSHKASAAPLGKCPAGEQYLPMTITGCDTCLADIRKRQPSGSSISNYECNLVDGRILCEACFKFPPPPPPPPSPPPPPPPSGFTCAPSDQNITLTTSGCDVCLDELNKYKPSGTYIFDYSCTGVIGSNKCEACYRKLASPPPPPPSGFTCAPSDQHITLTTSGCDVCLDELNKNKPSGTYIFDYSCTGVIGSNKCEACYRKFASPPPPASSCSCQKEMIVQDPTEPGKEACRYILAPKLAMVAI